MNTPENCPRCASPVRASIPDVGIQFECATIAQPSGWCAEGLPCVMRQRDQLAERVKRLEEECDDFMNLYADWKAYATNLESAGQRMLDGGYHAPHIKAEWREAKETRP